jgi:hypothetical protein
MHAQHRAVEEGTRSIEVMRPRWCGRARLGCIVADGTARSRYSGANRPESADQKTMRWRLSRVCRTLAQLGAPLLMVLASACARVAASISAEPPRSGLRAGVRPVAGTIPTETR